MSPSVLKLKKICKRQLCIDGPQRISFKSHLNNINHNYFVARKATATTGHVFNDNKSLVESHVNNPPVCIFMVFRCDT